MLPKPRVEITMATKPAVAVMAAGAAHSNVLKMMAHTPEPPAVVGQAQRRLSKRLGTGRLPVLGCSEGGA